MTAFTVGRGQLARPAAAAEVEAIPDEGSVRITKVERVEGYWRANASIAGQTRTFHNRFGTWQTDRRRSDDWPARVVRREALPAIARALTLKTRRLERRQEREA
jgi:hypothetical protein